MLPRELFLEKIVQKYFSTVTLFRVRLSISKYLFNGLGLDRRKDSRNICNKKLLLYELVEDGCFQENESVCAGVSKKNWKKRLACMSFNYKKRDTIWKSRGEQELWVSRCSNKAKGFWWGGIVWGVLTAWQGWTERRKKGEQSRRERNMSSLRGWELWINLDIRNIWQRSFYRIKFTERVVG